MMPVYLYEVRHPEAEGPPPKFETLKEAATAAREWNRDLPGHVIRRRCPRDRKAVLEQLLADQGLGHMKVWYRWPHPAGWMICEEVDGPGYQRLGYTFGQAVEMIRSGTPHRLWAPMP